MPTDQADELYGGWGANAPLRRRHSRRRSPSSSWSGSERAQALAAAVTPNWGLAALSLPSEHRSSRSGRWPGDDARAPSVSGPVYARARSARSSTPSFPAGSVKPRRSPCSALPRRPLAGPPRAAGSLLARTCPRRSRSASSARRRAVPATARLGAASPSARLLPVAGGDRRRRTLHQQDRPPPAEVASTASSPPLGAAAVLARRRRSCSRPGSVRWLAIMLTLTAGGSGAGLGVDARLHDRHGPREYRSGAPRERGCLPGRGDRRAGDGGPVRVARRRGQPGRAGAGDA